MKITTMAVIAISMLYANTARSQVLLSSLNNALAKYCVPKPNANCSSNVASYSSSYSVCVCGKGKFFNTARDCQSCPAGYYCPSVASRPYDYPCSYGTYRSSSGASSSSQCTSCPSFTYNYNGGAYSYTRTQPNRSSGATYCLGGKTFTPGTWQVYLPAGVYTIESAGGGGGGGGGRKYQNRGGNGGSGYVSSRYMYVGASWGTVVVGGGGHGGAKRSSKRGNTGGNGGPTIVSVHGVTITGNGGGGAHGGSKSGRGGDVSGGGGGYGGSHGNGGTYYSSGHTGGSGWAKITLHSTY